MHSVAHDLSAQHPLDGSAEQHDFVPHGFEQSDEPLVAAHELRANAEITTADIKDNCWITFFIVFIIVFWGDCLVKIDNQHSYE